MGDSSSSPPILVTGATGFIGSAVVRQLVAEGQSVRCLVRNPERLKRLGNLPVEPVIADLRDESALHRAAAGCRAVIHLAGPSAWPLLEGPDVRPLIVDGTRKLLSAAVAGGARRFVYVSSVAALGPARSAEPRHEGTPFLPVSARRMPYAAAKREAEGLCLQQNSSNLETLIVNPCEVYGPNDVDFVTAGNLIALASGRVAVVCRGGTAIAHVDDIADGIVRALDLGRSGERYLLGGENLTHRQLVEILDEIRGRKRPIVQMPNWSIELAARIARGSRLPFPIPLAAVPYSTAYWFLDCAKAQNVLGVAFRSARKTLEETVQWINEHTHLAFTE